MSIRIDRPSLNRETDKANIALVDRWIADTADKINHFISQLNVSKSESSAQINELYQRIEQMSEQLRYIRDDIRQVEASIIGHDIRIDDLEKIAANHETRIDDLEKGV